MPDVVPDVVPDVRHVAGQAGIEPFHVMRVVETVAARRSAGLAVYDMSAGQPSTVAPSAVRKAAHAALDHDRLGYTGAVGIVELREAIAGHYRHQYNLDVDPSDVVVSTGSSGAFLLAFLAAFKPGDNVVVTRPGYPAYRNMLAALGCRVTPLAGGNRFQPSIAQLDALTERPAGLILASPANPTGTMLSATELAAVVAWCQANEVRLISDEIYHGITYGETADCAWRASRDVIVVNSFSKYFSMTGWRLGWLLAPPPLRERIDRLAGNFALCPPTLSQLAAVAAFDSYDELDTNVARYALNRELLLRRLPEIGLDTIAPPDGAFYIYADVSRWTSDSLNFLARLLDETGVAMAPGIDFDQVDGGRFIRMCFAGEMTTVSSAMDILGDWLASQPVVEARIQ